MKEKFKKMNKKPLIFILILLILGVIGSTLAYYFSEVSFANKFKTMTYDVDLEEEFNDEFGTKKVYLKNNEETNVPVVLRLNYNESWTTVENGETYVISNKIGGLDAVDKNWTSAFTNDFVLADDGWYYYKKILGTGESVQILDSIAKNTTVINSASNPSDYNTYDYDLAFNYEAIQASTEAVLEIWNKTITINGGNVVWPS